MSWNLLERFIESEHFNKDPSLTVAYLARYASHVGIHYVLCSKLRQFSYEEIEFFLPQLCHLLISIDNESMALEEFIIDLCEESTFWLFQTYLNDLSFQPASNAFQTCRRIYNKVQSIVFGGADPVPRERIQDNVLPVTVLSSLVLASIAVPMLPGLAGPLAIAQARRPRPVEEELPETLTPLATSGTPHPLVSSDLGVPRAHPSSPSPAIDGAAAGESQRKQRHRQSLAVTSGNQGFISTHSLPDQRKHSLIASPTSPGVPRRPSEMSRRHTHNPKTISVASMTRDQKIRLLRQNYFRTEMQFLTALEGISSRLVAVPKPARLSALRAELALIAQDLPAEVDVPFICPATLVDGAASKSRHHRIVRLNPAEATSLNSAAKVPYLLMLEVIHEDFDFDPDSEENQQLLTTLLSDRGRQKRKLFDTSDAARAQLENLPVPQQSTHNDSVFEPTMGDLSSPALLQGPDGDVKGSDSPRIRGFANSMKDVSALSSTAGITTPRNSDGPISRSSTPGGMRQSPFLKGSTPDQAEVSALATHMRTAAQMLAQLEL
ncbi:phosphatidylinositol 4-kinase pik1-like, partial [Venturia nashicola]